jgi:hypothetical protein
MGEGEEWQCAPGDHRWYLSVSLIWCSTHVLRRIAMDEIEKIIIKNGALIKARQYLLSQSPSDITAIADISEKIIDLTGRHLAAIESPKVPQVTTKEQRQLMRLVQTLDKNVEKKASAGQVLNKARDVYSLEPWPPPSSSHRGISSTIPWSSPGSKSLIRSDISATRPLQRPRSKV